MALSFFYYWRYEINLGTILNFWLPASGTGTNTVFDDDRKSRLFVRTARVGNPDL
jgi:hypothetical protein